MGLKTINKFINTEIENVTVDIHVIGKYPQWESVIFILNINEIPEYCLVVDYCDENLYLIKQKIFSKYNISNINLLCWSHPHQDHSIGIQELAKEYCNKNTNILLPIGLENVSNKFDTYIKSTYDYFSKINKNRTQIHGIVRYASEYKQIEKIKYQGIKNKVDLYIETYSPIDKRINNIRNLIIPNMNDYSILMSITVNDRIIIFASDIEDNSINDIINNCEIFENVIFVKIPHHGSISSKKMLNAINTSLENTICVSTIYANNGRDCSPNPHILKEYKRTCNKVFCTSSKYVKNINTNKDYGIVSVRMKIPTTLKLIEDFEYDFDGDVMEI